MRLLLTLALIFTTFISFSAQARTYEDSFFKTDDFQPIGGVDLGTIDDDVKSVAWFANPEREIKYCSKHSADFPFTTAETSGVIKKAFVRWKDYLTKLRAHKADSPYALIASDAVESDCSSADLKFYFGYEDQDVRDDLEKLKSPIAFASRLTELDQPWASGYIWFDKARFTKVAAGENRWPALAKLEVIALHEIGHTMGFGHVPGTIMDARAIYKNFSTPKITTFLTIERDRLLSFQQPLALSGKIESHLYQRLTGRNASGSVKVSLSGNMESPVLTLESGGYKAEKNVSLNKKEFSYHRSQNNSFAVHNKAVPVEVKDGVSVLYGSIEDAQGKKHMLTAEYNMNREDFNVGPVVLRIQDEGEFKPLFQSFYANIRCQDPAVGSEQACQ